MASVHLDFVPPDRPGFVSLHIYEAATQAGALTEIEEVAAIGTYPNYISRYSTNMANSVDNWFAIQWEDDKGVFTEISATVQGRTETLVGKILSMVMQRDSTIDENVALQEVEAVVADYYAVTDPYSVSPAGISPKVLSGLTMLSLARVYIFENVITGENSSWVAGIVSMKNGSNKSMKAIQEMIDFANTDLGKNYSVILMMEEIAVAGGNYRLASVDLTRAIFELE